MRAYAIGVDKSGLLVRGREEIRRIQAAKNRRKKRLRPLPDSARVGFSGHRSYRASVSGRPASAGFLFLDHRDSFSCYGGQARIGMAQTESA